MTKVKVTVVSPYHNRATAVRLTLESIAAQDFDDFEALIWDDCSADHTFDELQKVQAEFGDVRIKVYRHDPNLGLTGGLNDAVARAEGQLVAVVGSGDVCASDRISKQVAALNADPEARFCACRSVAIDEVSGRRFSDEYFDKSRIISADLTPTCPFTHGSVMYRKSALKEIGGYDPIFKWCADWDVFLRLLENGAHACYVAEDLYFRYARMDGVSFSPKKSVEQIMAKYFVFSLIGRDETERQAVKCEVLEKGLKDALRTYWPGIARDLRARQIKLSLMGRKAASRELGELVDNEFGASTRWRLTNAFAKFLHASPVDPDKAIEAARRVKAKLL